MTLGAVLMLGGVIGGRGDELSGSVGAGGSLPSGGFSLPALPDDWNWSDLPVRLSIKVVNQPDMDTTTRVETDGTISFPYVGRIRAAG